MEKNTIFMVIASIIFLILLILFAVKPSIIGYSVYQQVKDSNYSIEEYGKNIKELETSLLIDKTNLSAYDTFTKRLLTELQEYSNKIAGYKSELDALKIEFNLSIIEIEKRKEEINNLKLQYDALAKNLANNLCCKAKVDNPDIKYYKVVDNKIACVEEGALEISCIV